MRDLAILGIGNVLEKDDGVAIYATKYIELNYSFYPEIDIINGGVKGIDLLSIFMEYKHIILLDAIDIDDEAGSIYYIPSDELRGSKISSGGAHEIGVLECLDMLELMEIELPRLSLLGIVAQSVTIEIGLSDKLYKRFDAYVDSLLHILKREGLKIVPDPHPTPLAKIIEDFKIPNSFIL